MKNCKGGFVFLAGLLLAVCVSGAIPGNGPTAAQATGSISGRVTDANGAGIQNVEVEIYTAIDELKGSGLTDAAGDYAIAGLSAGTYKVLFNPTGLNYLYEWYSDKTSFVMGDPVVVSAGQITPNIDAQLVTAGQISGKVTDAGGVGIAGIRVNLQTGGLLYEWCFESDSVVTDFDGNYVFSGLAAGDHAVEFQSNGLNFFPEWFDDKPDARTTDPITVTLGGHIRNVNASLKRGGQITGRASNSSGVGIEHIRVTAYQDGSGQQFQAETGPDGTYSIPLLSAGTYRVFFDSLGLNYFSEWYSDKSGAATADPVVISEGGIAENIDAVLTGGGCINGRVTDLSGNGINAVRVTVYDLTHNMKGEVFSDATGLFSVDKLPAGNYRVEYEANHYVSEWFNNKPAFETADPVAVAAEQTIPDIDAQLTKTGAISGRVSTTTGTPIWFVSVEAFDVFSQTVIRTTVSNDNGEYLIDNLPAGSYKLRYMREAFYPEWFNDKDSFQNADPVVVASGETTGIVDVLLTKQTTIDLTKDDFEFHAVQNGSATPAGSTILSNSGIGTLNWTAVPSDDWISVSPANGTGNAVISVGISRTDLAPGNYLGSIAVMDPNAWNSPEYIWVSMSVLDAGTDTPPFGSFDTPDNAGWLSSSVPVTGWALDDIGVESVKIYLGWMDGSRTFIGDATFVEGARPDIESQYWDYPQNERAGWGYMLLTNFLPNGGNGVYQLLAYATDTEGHEVLLGTKMIMCDNANAVKPFGAIDTPVQGGTASGGAYLNFGWALTPQPNMIPIDGSTLNVWVDGLPLGQPAYNFYRADIATLFPGYANSNGAVGYFSLDTTGYADGVHTIAWSAVDSAGNTDGIGSRYFTIQNAVPNAPARVAADPVRSQDNQGTAVEKAVGSKAERRSGLDPTERKAGIGEGAIKKVSSRTPARNASEIAAMPEDVRSPVYVKRGLAANAPAELILPETDGSIRIALPQVTRLAVYLNEHDSCETNIEMADRGRRLRNGIAASRGSDASEGASRESLSRLHGQEDFGSGKDSRMAVRSSNQYEAYQLVGEELRPLPVGSSFDPETGALYWQPGPGFLGEFRFIVIDTAAGLKRIIVVTIGQ